jgi:hypothetical protein
MQGVAAKSVPKLLLQHPGFPGQARHSAGWQAPYSPDMTPCDFWLIPRLKTPLKGSHFDSREDIIQNAMAQTSLTELLPAMEGPLG